MTTTTQATQRERCAHCARRIVRAELGWCHYLSGLYACTTASGELSRECVADPEAERHELALARSA